MSTATIARRGSTARTFTIILGVAHLLAAMVALVWIVSLPSKSECVASGRVVDPTQRHCEFPGGYQQLQEHAAFHATEVLFAVIALAAVGYLVRILWRRRMRRSTTDV
jgi:hypothetical protein